PTLQRWRAWQMACCWSCVRTAPENNCCSLQLSSLRFRALPSAASSLTFLRVTGQVVFSPITAARRSTSPDHASINRKAHRQRDRSHRLPPALLPRGNYLRREAVSMSSRPVMPARVEHPIPLRTALHHVVIAGTEQSLLPWIAAAGIGSLLGLALTWLPAIVVVSAVIGVGALLLVLKRPEFGILAILFFTSTIVPEESIPVVEAGPVQLYISDLILALLFGIILLRWLVERSSFRLIRTPLDGLMLGFFGIAVLATFWGIQRATTDISAAIPPLRIVTYYLLFFAVTNLIRSQRQLDTLIRGVFLLANLVAVTMILQFALGPDVPILPGRVEILNTGDARYNDITRITDFNGESPILLGLVCATAVWTRLSPKQRGLVAWFQ